MRRVGVLGQQEVAERFAASVRTRGIVVSLRPERNGTVGVWVLDEDQLADARDELAAFEAAPHSAQFQTVPAPTQPHESAVSPSSDDVPAGPPSSRVWRRLPATLALISVCVAIFLVMELGGRWGDRLHGLLAITPIEIHDGRAAWYPDMGLQAIRSGEVWRLITPAFMHGGPLHLVLNMAWLWLLGGAIETVRGRLRLLMLVLATAISSNLAEYWFDFGFNFSTANGFESQIGYRPDPFFLGMSGVVFGLFGFVWMRSRFVPRSQFLMPRDLVVWMLGWLVICTTGFVGPIANVAHGVGLLVGMAVGVAPRLWQRR